MRTNFNSLRADLEKIFINKLNHDLNNYILKLKEELFGLQEKYACLEIESKGTLGQLEEMEAKFAVLSAENNTKEEVQEKQIKSLQSSLDASNKKESVTKEAYDKKYGSLLEENNLVIKELHNLQEKYVSLDIKSKDTLGQLEEMEAKFAVLLTENNTKNEAQEKQIKDLQSSLDASNKKEFATKESYDKKYGLLLDENNLVIKELHNLQEKYVSLDIKSKDTLVQLDAVEVKFIKSLEEIGHIQSKYMTDMQNANFRTPLRLDLLSKIHNIDNIRGFIELGIYGHNIKAIAHENIVFSSIKNRLSLSEKNAKKLIKAYDLQVLASELITIYDVLIARGIAKFEETVHDFTSDNVKRAKIYLSIGLIFYRTDFSTSYVLLCLGYLIYLKSLLKKDGANGIISKVLSLKTSNLCKGLYLVLASKFAVGWIEKIDVAIPKSIAVAALDITSDYEVLVGLYWIFKKSNQTDEVKLVLQKLEAIENKTIQVNDLIKTAKTYLAKEVK